MPRVLVPKVEYEGASCELQAGESVLDALLRSGMAVPHSCKAGSCGSCMLRAVAPCTPPARSQAGLKDSWKAQGYFLSCVCHPESDLTAGPVGAEARVAVSIAAIERLTETVLRVRLVADAPFEFRAGQFVTVFRDDGLARSYSLASLPSEGMLELHVRVFPGGRMSEWLASVAKVGTRLHVQGPSGDCFYTPGHEDQPLLLAGTGTGLAPLYGIAREALSQGHRGPVQLFHGAVSAAGLYLRHELLQLAAAHPNFTYTPTTLELEGPIDRAILTRFPKLTGWRGFLCGDPAIVNSLKKKMFLAGAALNEIHADAFLPSVA